MKKIVSLSVSFALILSFLVACEKTQVNKEQENPFVTKEPSKFDFTVDPETFNLMIDKDGVKEQAAQPLPKTKVQGLKQQTDHVEWIYPEKKVKVKIEKKENYLDITLRSLGVSEFQWPQVDAKAFMLPLWEGKYIPSEDQHWKTFLKDEELRWSESFSMNFFALNKAKYSLVYLLKNPFNNQVQFNTDKAIQLQFSHEFPSINKDKTYGFRLYVTDNDPVQIASLYKQKMTNKTNFVTLQEKAKSNPNIEKLYGAPHIYLWNNELLTGEEINWDKWNDVVDEKVLSGISKLLSKTEDGSQDFDQVVKQMTKEKQIDRYQKTVLVRALNRLVKMKEFAAAEMFDVKDPKVAQLVNMKGALSEQKRYERNKKLLKLVLKEAISPIAQWGNANADQIVKEMKQQGIKKAWIGLPNWANGLMNPGFVEQANQTGYLIAPYDSYHSIQKEENIEWNTAYFPDPKLYDQATITKSNGEKEKGFLGRGRKLNPMLALPSVKKRMSEILQDSVQYNSWFLDADATGEIYDDYSKQHPNTQAQDRKARLERMAYVANDKKMVVGSETGNDFSAGILAYAHGLETPVIKWSDLDMRTNKTSPYYVGAYYSPQGGVPPRYKKKVPIKELYQHIYLDPAYSLPLYKLVYNDAVVTTHHWEWGSFKIKEEARQRFMMGYLYNVPPLYHLDQQTWAEDKQQIVSFLKDWAPFGEKAVTYPMTNFQVLTKDRLVQSTQFGKDMKVIANFSKQDYTNEQGTIKPGTVLVIEGDHKKIVDLTKSIKS